MRDLVETTSLRDLIAHLVDSGKAYARAEITYVKSVATARISAAAVGIGLAIVSLLFVQAALTVLLVALGMALARWLGFAAGFAVAALVGFLLAGLLAWLGVRRVIASGSAT